MSITNYKADDWSGLKWHVGLLHNRYKYLTAEKFSCKVNANGVTLKKKQLWSLEPFIEESEEEAVCLRSYLGKYLVVDKFGNITCDSEERDISAKFEVLVLNEKFWAFRSATCGYCLGATEDKLICSVKDPGLKEIWTVHLAAHPQVNLRSVGSLYYVRQSFERDEIKIDVNTPWVNDDLFTMQFKKSQYVVQDSNGKYLKADGKLSEECEYLFGLKFHNGHLALKAAHRRYAISIDYGQARDTMPADSANTYLSGITEYEETLLNVHSAALVKSLFITVNKYPNHFSDSFIEVLKNNARNILIVANEYSDLCLKENVISFILKDIKMITSKKWFSFIYTHFELACDVYDGYSKKTL